MIAVKSQLSHSPNALRSALSAPATPSNPQDSSPETPKTLSMSVDKLPHDLSSNTSSPPVRDSSEDGDRDFSTATTPPLNGTSHTISDESARQGEQTKTSVSPRSSVGNISQAELSEQVETGDSLPVNREARSDEDETPQSVIHAPTGFGEFKVNTSPTSVGESSGSPSQKSDITIKSPLQFDTEKKGTNSPISPPPITTTIAPVKDWSERATPRAQTRQEVEDLERRPHSSNLEDIPENLPSETDLDDGDDDPEETEFSGGNFQDTEEEINALKTALAECWTLCNTLASLSYIHRERLFNFAGKGDMQEQAWKSCWKLCQKLYDSRDDDYASQIRPTLDLCRDFCQSLFEVRVRENEVADSVLRVSFELNNHLYNTHDRNLPEAFRERTLDFYITLCHRLMKQRTRLAEETDSLLRACWSLAEMLFSLRQNKREGKKPDEELLGSAIQACWELCDLFREGWTQIRPDRGTPRPSQATFTQAFQQAKQNELASAEEPAGHVNPETPTTIFEDTATVSPDEAPVPNILVLGPGNTQPYAPKWSSTSSTLSGYSRTSEQTTSSTNTVTTPSEDPNLALLKLLIVKAAINSGYQRGGPQNLSSFVKSLSSDSFGTLSWQMTLLENYKKLVVVDPAFRSVGPPARAGAVDIARAVTAMVQSGQYTWLRDLYRLVFGFHTEDAVSRKNTTIQT